MYEKAIRKKSNKWWKYVTVEPTFALYWFVVGLNNFFQDNLFLQKLCHPNFTSEPDVRQPCTNETAALSEVASIHAFFNPIGDFIQFSISIFVIHWCTCSGKRFPSIFLPLIGTAFDFLSGCIHSFFWKWSTISAAISYEFFYMLSGGNGLLHFGTLLYISEINDENVLTAKIGVLAFLEYLTIPISNLVSGYVLVFFGLFWSFFFGLCLTLTGIGLGLIFVKCESFPSQEYYSFWDKINPINIVKSINILFKKRIQNKRMILNFLIIIGSFEIFTETGEKSVLYLYFRQRFHWKEEKFGVFAAYDNLVIAVGIFIAMIILSTYYHFHDGLIGCIAAIWNIFDAISYLLASQTWQIYMVPIFELFRGVNRYLSSSYMSKLVEKEELGNLTICNLAVHILISFNKPLYNMLFKINMDAFPECFFLVNLVIALANFLFFSIVYHLSDNI